MRSYGQLCAVARALDVVGDRWTLLIVRELLILEQARFTDLENGLPGIAPNLLTQRLQYLAENDLLYREVVPAPVRGTVYRLTDRGRSLEGVVRELLKWGAPTVPEAPDDAQFQMHWLSMPARHLLRDRRAGETPVVVRFGDLADGFDVTAGDGSLRVDPCRREVSPDAVVTGPGPVLVGLVQGAVPLGRARRAGVRVTGDASALRRLLPLR
jgi:DNA-binding HxlR family transcriptional regulator